MHSLNIIIIIILSVCLLPYIFAIIARKFSGYDVKKHDNPREFVNQATGLAGRANAVQQNSFESLPLFIASILMADYLVIADKWLIILGIAYLVFRILYGVSYLANWQALRSTFWLLSILCPILLLLICIWL